MSPTRKPSHRGKDREVYDRLFGSLPYKEATGDIRVLPTPKDILDGEPQSFSACALALACQHMYGSQAVLVLRTTAYVDLPQPDGTRAVERFILPQSTQRLIQTFDTTGEVHPGGFVFRAPRGSATLVQRRQRNAKRLLKGYTPVRHYATRKDPLTLLGVRNGTGLWRLEANRLNLG